MKKVALDLDAYEKYAWAALRILAGSLFLCHGLQKIFGLLGTEARPALAQPVLSQLWVGGVIQLVGGALIAVGLFTRAVGFLCSGQMAVAYFQFHWKLEGGTAILPIINGGEDTVLYCFLFLLMVFKGAGIWSLDHTLRRAR